MFNQKFNSKMLTASLVGLSTFLPVLSFAEEGTTTGIPQIISTAATNMKADALSVMTAGVGLGIVFWGGKLLWSKFKSMSK